MLGLETVLSGFLCLRQAASRFWALLQLEAVKGLAVQRFEVPTASLVSSRCILNQTLWALGAHQLKPRTPETESHIPPIYLRMDTPRTGEDSEATWTKNGVLVAEIKDQSAGLGYSHQGSC